MTGIVHVLELINIERRDENIFKLISTEYECTSPSLLVRDLLVYCFVLQLVVARDCPLLFVFDYHVCRYGVTDFLFKADVVVCELAHFCIVNAKDFSFLRCTKAETRNEMHGPYNDSLSLVSDQ